VGQCPFDGCDIRVNTCKHLDSFLVSDTTSKYYRPTPDILFTDKIEKFGMIDGKEHPVWELFLELRGLPLSREQVRILVRVFGCNMSRAQIMREFGWNSVRDYEQKKAEALEIVKRYWR
jgi:hypothetical protein